MLAGRPDMNADDALGQIAAQLGEIHQDLWEENVPAVEVFADMQTQWNVGMSGVIGLRYEALPLLLDLRGIVAAARADVVAAVRVMERAALEFFRRG